MIRILLHGCAGKMGRAVTETVAQDSQCEIVAGIDPTETTLSYPTYTRLEDCKEEADVVIDFSTAAAVPELLSYCERRNLPVVLCTTGLSENLSAQVAKTAKHIALLKSANMSLGVNLLLNLVNKAASVLYDAGFDIEIVEKHHNQKIDAPSGTALALADAANDALHQSMHYVYDRSQVKQKREKTEIGIHAIRGGTIVGEHDVIFAGKDEIIQLSHTAMSKEVFAVGAVKAAKFLKGKPAGFYTMQDVLL